MKKLVYVAAPFSADPIEGTIRACKVADELLEMGYGVFVPHCTMIWHFISPKSWEEWLEIDAEILKRCDALLRLEGISLGAAKEMQLAQDLGIPVYYSIENLVENEKC